jgi:hypothetical protein
LIQFLSDVSFLPDSKVGMGEGPFTSDCMCFLAYIIGSRG